MTGLLICNGLFAQIVIDMANEEYPDEYDKNGEYYIKDVGEFMNPYVGTWQYIDGDTEFRITIEKVEMYNVTIPEYYIDYYEDGLRINYQRYENGVLIFESPQNSTPTGLIEEFGNLSSTFTDYERFVENNILITSSYASFDTDFDLIPISSNEYNLHFRMSKIEGLMAFEMENGERRGTYYVKPNPNAPYFSVPNDIIMTKM